MATRFSRSHGWLERGLTLGEAVTSVGVVAILATLLVPAAASLKESSRRTRCADNMRRLMAGVHAYADEHQGKGPIRGWSMYSITEQSREAYGWGGTAKVLINLGMLHEKYNGGHADTLYCPSTYAMIRDHPSYGWKTAFNPSVAFTIGGYNYAIVFESRSLASPDFTGAELFPQARWASRFVTWINNTWKPRNPGKEFTIPGSPALVSDLWVIYPVHDGGMNVLYSDGHVRYHDTGRRGFSSSNPLQYDLWYDLSLKQ